MALIFKHQKCPACGEQHHFELQQGVPEPDQAFDFVCPMTGERAELRPTETPEPAEFWLQGAVRLETAHRVSPS